MPCNLAWRCSSIGNFGSNTGRQVPELLGLVGSIRKPLLGPPGLIVPVLNQITVYIEMKQIDTSYPENNIRWTLWFPPSSPEFAVEIFELQACWVAKSWDFK